MGNDTKSKDAIKLPPLYAVVSLVKRGHRDMLPRLRAMLREEPAVWQYVGDLGQQATRAWVELVGGRDDLLKESTILFAEEMKKSLVEDGASRLEKLAAERIAACWLETEYFRHWHAEHPAADGTKVGELYKRRFEDADRRYERALKSLAEIKKLLPRTIQVEFLHPPMVQAPVRPSMPSTNGTKKEYRAEPSPSFNGFSRFNGSRMAGVMEPMGVGKG